MNKLEWFGTVSSILGSFAIAFGHMKLGYTLFLFGSLSWLVVGVVTKNRPLVVLNGTFFVANVIGFLRNVVV